MTFFEALKNMTIEEISSFLSGLMGCLLVKMGAISEKDYKDNLEKAKDFIMECLERQISEDDKA